MFTGLYNGVLSGLPILEVGDRLVEIMKGNKSKVLVLVANTGSGKSVGAPILFRRLADFKVIHAQPRVLSSIAVCERVATGLGCEVGADEVGYITGIDASSDSIHRSLTFCTDGVLTQILIGKEKPFKNNEIVIIDEWHEQTTFQWVNLALLRRRMIAGECVKVVVTSATLDKEELRSYFDGICEVEVIKVEGRLFDVERSFERVEEGRVDEVTISRVKNVFKEGLQEGVLIFRSGVEEISSLKSSLIEVFSKDDQLKDIPVFELHSKVDLEVQHKILNLSGRFVVVATNIAETSITIPGITRVFDDGRKKIIVESNNHESMVVVDISKKECTQRAGRAGRVREGFYTLISNTSFDSRRESAIPEVELRSISHLILQLVCFNIDIRSLVFPKSIPADRLVKGFSTLVFIGAIEEDTNSSLGFKVTECGKFINSLGIDVRLGKILFEARQLDVFEECLFLVAILSSGQSLKFRTRKGEVNTYQESIDFFWGEVVSVSKSLTGLDSEVFPELIAFLRVREDFESRNDDGRFDFKPYGVFARTFFAIKREFNRLLGRCFAGEDDNVKINAVERVLFLESRLDKNLALKMLSCWALAHGDCGVFLVNQASWCYQVSPGIHSYRIGFGVNLNGHTGSRPVPWSLVLGSVFSSQKFTCINSHTFIEGGDFSDFNRLTRGLFSRNFFGKASFVVSNGSSRILMNVGIT